MKVRVTSREQVLIVDLIGKIDFESMKAFRIFCNEQLSADKIIFDFKDLNFVGSSGIGCLVEAIQTLLKQPTRRLGFCQMRSEFRRIFAAGELREVPVFETLNETMMALAQGLPITPLRLIDESLEDADLELNSESIEGVDTPQISNI